MATPAHTPEGRGFNSSLIYFEHKNSFWTQQLMQSSCQDIAPLTVDLWSNGAPARTLNGTQYEEFMFRDRLLDVINGHDLDAAPLFLLYTPHAAHCPLQVGPRRMCVLLHHNSQAASPPFSSYLHVGMGSGNYSRLRTTD